MSGDGRANRSFLNKSADDLSKLEIEEMKLPVFGDINDMHSSQTPSEIGNEHYFEDKSQE